MKHFMIKYQFKNGIPADWHREVAAFVSALDNDGELKGRIGYRVMKNRDDTSYFHLAAAADQPSRRCSRGISSSTTRIGPGRSQAERSRSRRSR